jgi:hypothetical protein
MRKDGGKRVHGFAHGLIPCGHVDVHHHDPEPGRGCDRGGNGTRDVMELQVEEHVPISGQHQGDGLWPRSRE